MTWQPEADGGASRRDGEWVADVWRTRAGHWAAAYTDPRENTHVVAIGLKRRRSALSMAWDSMEAARARWRREHADAQS